MARNHIQVMIPEQVLQNTEGIDWMDYTSILKALSLDEAVNEVAVLGQKFVQEQGCYVLLCEHPSYPGLEDYQTAPSFPYDAPEVIPSGA